MRFICSLIILSVVLPACANRRSAFHFKGKGDFNCRYIPKFNADQRASIFPFNKASEIELVSFRCHKENYPVSLSGVVADSLVERKIISGAQRDSLSDIIMNNFYTVRPNYGVFTQCYTPRNAIVFYDSSATVIAYILLCFHCDRYELSDDSVNWGDECTQKIKMLRDVFINAGVVFGTDLDIFEYPGEQFEGIVAPPLDTSGASTPVINLDNTSVRN